MDFKIKIKISPNSSKCEIINSENDSKIKLTAQPIEGKANKCLIDFLSKTFKIPKSNIEIVKGETSKEKTILFKNLDEVKLDVLKSSFS